MVPQRPSSRSQKIQTEYKLGIPKGEKLVFQRKKAFTKRRQEIIKTEVQELLNARIIKTIDFPKYLSNPVVVAKPGGARRVCIDFTNLNRAILKEPFPLTRIEQLPSLLQDMSSYLFWTPTIIKSRWQKNSCLRLLLSLMMVSIAIHACLSD